MLSKVIDIDAKEIEPGDFMFLGGTTSPKYLVVQVQGSLFKQDQVAVTYSDGVTISYAGPVRVLRAKKKEDWDVEK